MKRIILSLIMVMFVFTTNSYSQLDTVLGPHIYLYHPLDTVISDGNHQSPTFNKHLVKRLYLKAIEDIFGDFPFTGYLNIDSILPQFSNQKNLLQSITSQFGNYLLKYDTMNTIDVNLRFMYYLEFSGYYDYDSLQTIFESDSIISAVTWVPNYYLTSIPTDLGLQPRVHFSEFTNPVVFPNGSPDNVRSDYHDLGWYWNYYRTKLPLAWEMTYGQNNIYIGMQDEFSDLPTNTDLCHFVPNQNIGDGSSRSLFLGNGHGLWTTSTANACRDNGINNPAIGYAPESVSLGYPILRTFNFASIDADGSDDDPNVIRNLHVVNMSIAASWGFDVNWANRPDWPCISINSLNAGITFVAAAANFMNNPPGGEVLPNGHVYYPTRVYPGAVSRRINGDYVKVICVGATDNGYFSCNGSKYINRWSEELGEFEECFHINYNFSVGNTKFPDPALPVDEQDAIRSFAFMDIVAPVYFMSAIQDVVPGDVTRRYTYDSRGTSQATPQVTGTVALMQSINNRFGLTGHHVHNRAYDILTFTADKIPDGNLWWPGEPDGMGNTYTNGTSIDGSDVQEEYVTQIHDNLKRSWAQRMGFGRLNAYRAVAHSIANKGEYEYSQSQILPVFTGNGNETPIYIPDRPVANHLIHFGSRVREGPGYFEIDAGTRGPTANDDEILNVIEWGGTTKPYELLGIQHNNQGVTKFNSTENSEINLELPNNTILAIDGILVSEQQDFWTDRNIWAMNRLDRHDPTYTSSILVEGYLKDVELIGKIMVSDLIIDGTPNSETSGLFFTGRESEIYGDVVMNQDARIIVNEAVVTMRTGSSITMNGVHDIFIGWGSYNPNSTLIMGYSTEIATTNGRKIIVQPACSLIVDFGAKVNLDCEVEVLNGGFLILRDSSIVSLKKFTINPGGHLIVEKEVHLHLAVDGSTCSGFAEFNGAPDLTSTGGRNGRIYVTGPVNPSAYLCKTFTHDINDLNEFSNIDFINILEDNTNSNLKIEHTEFANVLLFAYNYSIDPVLFSTFYANPIVPLSYIPPLFYIWVNEWAEIQNMNYEFFSCNFFDFEQKQLSMQTQYNFSGLSVMSANSLEVNECLFWNLLSGVETLLNNVNRIHDNLFSANRVGLIDQNSTNEVCSNYFQTNEIGVSLYNSLTSNFFDNFFQSHSISVRLDNTISANFRNNTYLHSGIGINLFNSFANLKDIIISEYPYRTAMYGRNTFYNLSTYSYGLNPYVLTGLADIKYNTELDLVEIECGFNDMSSLIGVNLFREPNLSNINLDIGYNDWQTQFSQKLISSPNILTSGLYLNTSSDCNNLCGLMINEDFCYQPAMIDYSQYRNIGNWINQMDDSSFLDSAFTYSFGKVSDDSTTSSKRISYISDSYESGILNSSSLDNLETLSHKLVELIVNTNEPIDIRKYSLRALNRYFIKNSEIDSVRHYNNLYLTSNMNGIDSLYSKWDLLLCDFLEIDSVPDYRNDSLFSLFNSTYIEDIRYWQDSSFIPPPPDSSYYKSQLDYSGTDLIDKAMIKDLVPNPTTNRVEISYFLPDDFYINLEIYNSSGVRVMNLIENQLISAGNHTVNQELSALSSGLYFVTISYPQGKISKQLILNK